MHFIIRDMKLKFDGHKTLIMAERVPNVFERLVLRMKPTLMHFIGKGHTWQTFPEYATVGSAIANQLHGAEQRWQFVKRKNPNAKYKTLAQSVKS